MIFGFNFNRFVLLKILLFSLLSGCVHRPVQLSSNNKEYDLNKKRVYETVYLDHFSSIASLNASANKTIVVAADNWLMAKYISNKLQNKGRVKTAELLSHPNSLLNNERAVLKKLAKQNVKSIDKAHQNNSTGAFFLQTTLLQVQRLESEWQATDYARLGAIISFFPFIGAAGFTLISALTYWVTPNQTVLLYYMLPAAAMTAIFGVLTSAFAGVSLLMAPSEKKYRVETLTQVYWLNSLEIKARTRFIKGREKPKIVLSGLEPIKTNKMRHIITETEVSENMFSKTEKQKNINDFVREFSGHVYIPAIMEAIESISLESRHRKAPKKKGVHEVDQTI